MADVRTFGPFVLDAEKRSLHKNSSKLSVGRQQMSALLLLTSKPGQSFSVSEIWNAISGGRTTSVDAQRNRVKVVVSELRSKLPDNGRNPIYITFRDEAYVFVAHVEFHRDSAVRSEGSSLTEIRAQEGYCLAVPVTTISAEEPPRDASVSPTEPSQEPSSNSSNKTALARAIAIGGGLVLVVAVLISALYSRGHLREPLVLKYKPLTNDGRPKQGPVLAGGKRLWFLEQIEGKWTVVSIGEGGGEAVPLALPFEAVGLFDLTTDGSTLLLWSFDRGEEKLWAWPVAGGAPQLFPVPHGAIGVGWSPDKQIIAFGEGSALTLASAGGTIKQLVTPAGTEVRYPRWSSDGAHIAFALVDKKLSLMTLRFWDRFTNEAHSVTTKSPDREDQPAGTWTKDGRYYLFAAGQAQRHDLWVVPTPKGFSTSRLAPAVRLTNGPFDWTWPATSQTTSQLFAIGESSRGELGRLTLGEKDWHPYLGGISAYELDYSRDGKMVAYTSYPEHRLWTAQVDGAGRIQLAWPDFEAHMPHWSPDGTRIAFMGQKPGRPWRVMIVQVANDIGEEAISGGEDQGVPSWSKDGDSLVYGEWLSANPQATMKLHLLDLKAKVATTLEGSSGLWTVRWSPDGTYLAALRQNSKGLLLSRPGVPQWREILRADNIDDLTWSWDSKYLYLTASDPRELLRVEVSRGSVEKIADIHAFPIAHEHWFGAAKDGSALALRGVLGPEIYALDWVAP